MKPKRRAGPGGGGGEGGGGVDDSGAAGAPLQKPQAAGAKPRIILLSRDITERKRSQEQLQLTAQVFDPSSEAIVIADPSHRIVRINRAFSRITGCQESEAVGQSVRLLTMAEAGPDCNADAVYARLARQERWEGESW